MNKFSKIHETLTLVQVSFTLSALTLTSLGGVVKQPFLVFFWYMGLFGIATIIVTNFIIGMVYISSRVARRLSINLKAKRSPGRLPRPKGVQV
jgi:hypothetical protein